MARYQQGNVSFEPPKDWEDLTIHAFSPRPDPQQPASPSVKMWREPLVQGTTLKQHVNRLIVQLAKELPGFDLLDNEDTTVAGKPAYRIRCRFKSRQGPIEQNRVMVDPAGDPEPCVTVFFMASRTQDSEAMRKQFAEVLETVRFQAGGGAVNRYGTADPAAANVRSSPGLVPAPPTGPLRAPDGVTPPPAMFPPTIVGPPQPAAGTPDNPSFAPPSMPMPGRTR